MIMRKAINAIKQFFGGTEHELDSRPVSHILGDEIDIAEHRYIAEYRYNTLDSFESPVMCGMCGKTPAKYSVTTHPSDGPPYSHDYCARCFTSPLAKEQIDANDHRV